MIYVNKDTINVDIPKSGNTGEARQIRLLNLLTNIDIYTEVEDLGNDTIMYAFNIESIVKDLVVGLYDYFILDANGSVLDNGILQYDSFNSSVSAYSLDDPKVIQYSLGDVYTPIPETIKTVFVDGVYDTDGVDKVNVNTGVENQYVEDLLKDVVSKQWVEEQGFLTEGNLEEVVDEVLATKDYISETELKTINGQSIIGSGNIEIEGGTGGGASFTDITQAEYDALVASGDIEENTVYNITDATPIVIEDYALKTELDAIANSLPTTYNPYNTTTSSTSGYNFPRWNERGLITGTLSTAYQASQNINGSSRTIYSTSSSSMPTIYAPTSAGQAGQVLLSNGSGAPVWSEYKSDATAYLLHTDFVNGTYSTAISEYYLECIATNQVKPMQFVFTSTVQDGDVTNNVYSSYLPSSGRIYAGNVELWLLYTEDCISWTNHHYLITNTEVSLTTTTGTFGGLGWE